MLFDQTNTWNKGLGLSIISPFIQEEGCVATGNVEELSQMVMVCDRSLAFYVIGASPSLASVS